MNSRRAFKQSLPYEPPIRDENHFLWIETLVCDFLNWTLNAETQLSNITSHKIARLFGEVWRLQFSQPDALSAGAESLQMLLDASLAREDLLKWNQRVEQELRIFFLSRQNDPLLVRITQTEFVSTRRFLIDQMIMLFDIHRKTFIAPAMPPAPPANDAPLPPS